MAEHRHVMTQHLGRALLPGENVHHRNGDRTDNRLENLELWSTAQPSGQRLADQLEWAVELLEHHGRRHRLRSLTDAGGPIMTSNEAPAYNVQRLLE